MKSRHGNFEGKDRERFVQALFKELTRTGATELIRYDSEDFMLVLKLEKEDEVRMNLHNAWQEYRNAPTAQRHQVLERWANLLRSMGDNLSYNFSREEALDMLLPRVLERTFYEHQKLRAVLDKTSDQEPDRYMFNFPYQPIAKHLASGLVLDMPEQIVILPEAHIKEWQISVEDAYERSMSNLSRISTDSMRKISPGLYVSPWQDNHDGSRILLLDKIKAECEVEGEMLAFIPNRDHLLITGAADVAGLNNALNIVEKIAAAPRSMSFVPLVLRSDKWELYQLPAFHPEFTRFEQLMTDTLLTIYGENKELLDQLKNETEQQDLYIARFNAVQNTDTGKISTYCVWSDGVEALLPRTDFIGFARYSSDPENDDVTSLGLAPFDQVTELLGPETIVFDGCYPERYRVKRFPTAQELDQLTLKEEL
ncbi:MAG: hypothetical protein K2W95_21215 [Candidatus Obscuribacterales bacterium]|nr:hypothetical protein [Candidatus Obscuribacterales bacterium]